jgi:hypothetical protein
MPILACSGVGALAQLPQPPIQAPLELCARDRPRALQGSQNK